MKKYWKTVALFLAVMIAFPLLSAFLMVSQFSDSSVSRSLGQIIFWLIPIAVLVLSGWLIMRGVRGKSGDNRLMTTGMRVEAEITGIGTNVHTRIMGQPARAVNCRWQNPQDGKYYHFVSENLWYDPTRAFLEFGVRTIPVYIHPNNISKYYVDTQELERLTRQWEESNVRV